MAFNWRNYIELSDALGENGAGVIRALDQIAATPEGRELIKKAYRTSNEDNPLFSREKIRIGTAHDRAPTANLLQTSSLLDQGSIKLDIDQLERLTYKNGDEPGGNEVRPGYVHSILHELYHVADARCSGNAMIAGIINRLPEELIDPGLGSLTESQLATVRTAAHDSFTAFVAAQPGARNTRSMNEKALEYIQSDAFAEDIARRTGISNADFIVRPLTPEFMQERLLATKKTWDLAIEPAATQYTDAFMHKYFDQPPRVHYENIAESSTALPVTVESLSCGLGPMPKYDAHAVTIDGNTPSPPAMHTTPCELPQKTR